MANQDAIVTLLTQLVQINSINPELVIDAAGEGEIADFVANWLTANDVEVHIQPVTPTRSNVIGIVRGSGGGRSLMLNAHLDTVGVETMTDPYNAHVESYRLFGRGAYDMKGSLAACLLTLVQARELALRGDVMVSFVVDEEYASLGTQQLLQEWSNWPADAVIVTEPTELTLCTAHKGFVWYEIETIGRAAHGSRPHLGVDAIAKMGRVLTELAALDQRLQAGPSDPLVGSPSLHASLIRGGTELSSYPAQCVLSVERRTIAGETHGMFEAEARQILDQISATDPAFQAELRMGLTRAPFSIPADAPLVQLARQQAESVLGQPVPLTGVSFWMDAALFAEAGVPTIVFGPIGEGAHAAVEWVDLASIGQCLATYLAIIGEWCA